MFICKYFVKKKQSKNKKTLGIYARMLIDRNKVHVYTYKNANRKQMHQKLSNLS